VDFLYFLAQQDSRRPNWQRLLPFPSPVPPLLRLTLPHRRVVSRFLPMEPRRARYLRFIFWQCFILSPPFSSRNQSIKSPPLPLDTLLGLPDSRPSLLLKGHLNLDHSTASLFCLLPSQSTTPSELHPPSSFLLTVVPHTSSLHTMTPMMMN
jgi:hypothetical protein